MKHLPEHIQKHIQAIAEHEKAFQSRKTALARTGHLIGGFVGSSGFIVLHVVWFTSWLVLNLLPVSRLRPFDPFPFPLLGSIIEIEGIFLASFILIRQNQMNRRSDERDHLTLQVLLLAEQEITTLLDIERRKSIHTGMTKLQMMKTYVALASPPRWTTCSARCRDISHKNKEAAPSAISVFVQPRRAGLAYPSARLTSSAPVA